MPVIGRLDRQVDEIIISPVSKRRRDEDPATTDEDGTPTDEDSTPTGEDSPARSPSPATQTPARDESSRDADELPVWLL